MDLQGSSSTRHDVLERLLLDTSAEPTDLPLSLLQDITNCFSDDREIGSGGFAVVYKGMVGNGRMVAVKKLSRTFDMDENQFHKEVQCLMKSKHRNIVRFLGYCADTQGKVADYEGKFVMADLRNWLLCFEYVPKGSLDEYITDASCGLEWRERYQIIKGICSGLNYLHEKHIIHLDLKPGNILVDYHMVPKIADFGLSRCFAENQTRALTLRPCGSQGYMAVESYGGEITYASDIYSLGVIITEILTGAKGYPAIENVIESWMNRLDGETQLEQLRVCTMVGIECMNSNPKKRPVARDIIDRLEKTNGTDCCAETSSSAECVNLLPICLTIEPKEEKIGKLAAIKELPRTEDVEEFSQMHREDYYQEEASQYHLSSRGLQDTKEKDSRSKATVFDKLKNLDIFGWKARKNYARNSIPILLKGIVIKLFKKEELKPILKDANIIGNGGYGLVYWGILGKEQVAVRKLIGKVLDNEQFANEVIIQSQVIHKNIVRLIGCCLEMDSPMLVYEFVSSGSLHDILHGNNEVVPLNLNLRLNIAAESAVGLAYMHSHARVKILHGDVKPANILLDDNFMPKISDFGLSKMIARDRGYASIIIGDLNYMDPVYLQTGLLSEKTDVYSFGIVILELISRKKAKYSNNNSLVMSFLEHHNKGTRATELFDKEITAIQDLEFLDSLAGMAVECLNLDVDKRPTMTDVAERLLAIKRSRKLYRLG